MLKVRNTRYDGFAAGAGLTFGYVASISNRWTIDAHAGIGLVLFHQKENNRWTTKLRNILGCENIRWIHWIPNITNKIGVTLHTY